ncbi:unnamed protein product [Sphacelaria rigidula]
MKTKHNRYCTSAQADEMLYTYCPKKYREADYRMQVVLRELREYDSDIIMLQASVSLTKNHASS